MKLLTGVFAGERSHGLLKKVGYRVREVLGRGKCVFIEMMKWWEGSRNEVTIFFWPLLQEKLFQPLDCRDAGFF